MRDFYARPLLKRIFKKGRLVYENPPLEALREYCRLEVEGLWEEVKRFENPHSYYVDLSKELWKMKNDMLSEFERES